MIEIEIQIIRDTLGVYVWGGRSTKCYKAVQLWLENCAVVGIYVMYLLEFILVTLMFKILVRNNLVKLKRALAIVYPITFLR